MANPIDRVRRSMDAEQAATEIKRLRELFMLAMIMLMLSGCIGKDRWQHGMETMNVAVADDDFGPDVNEMATRFSDMMIRLHSEILDGDDKEARDAVVVKAVSLVTLAFGVPAVRGEPLNIPEALTKLAAALAVLKLKGAN